MQLVITTNARNFIGPIFQTNEVKGDESDTITQSNVMDVTQNLEGTNDCDEANTGDNIAECGPISLIPLTLYPRQTKWMLLPVPTHDQSNLFAVTQNLVATNDCDETGNWR